jgi:hypothetical protein
MGRPLSPAPCIRCVEMNHQKCTLVEDLAFPPGQASALPFSVEAFRIWLRQAKPGDRIEYHQGFLTVDRSPTSRFADHERRILTKLASTVLKAADASQVHLLQRRHGAGDYSYIAVRARRRAKARAPTMALSLLKKTAAHDHRDS